MIQNRINIFLLLSFLCVVNIGFSATEKRLMVNTHSMSFKTKLIDIETISKGLISKEMFYSIPIRSLGESPIYKFIISDSIIYAMQDCQFNVWEWKDTIWVNLYKTNNNGWCMPNYYYYENKLLGFTGAGFWTSESSIYFFDSHAGSWELVNTENKVPHFVSNIDFRIGNDTIISFVCGGQDNGQYIANSIEKCYGFNLKLKKWFAIQNNLDLNILSSMKNKESLSYQFDMENTFHSICRKYHLVFDKKSLSFYYITNKNSTDFDFSYNTNSTTTIINNDGEVIIIKDEVPADGIFAGTISFSELEDVENEIQEDDLFLWIIIRMGVLILSGIGLFWLLRSYKKKSQISKKKPSSLILTILENTGQVMDSNQIDVLLKISDDPSFDSRRAKRSRVIKGLNTEYEKIEGKVLITRERDPKDKRYMLYHIKK